MKTPAIIIITWVLLALASVFFPLIPNQVSLDNILTSPGEMFVFGADELGRPVFDRLLMGARVSLLMALGVVSVSLVIGIAIGTIAGYAGGRIDRVLTRIMDVFLAFPGLLLAIGLAGLMGPGLVNLVIALSIMGWVGFARLARVQVIRTKKTDYVVAANSLGSSKRFIAMRHLLPSIAAPVIVETSYATAGVIIAEAGLSFLGLGLQPPEASWGNMLQNGVRYMLVAPHLVIFPGLALSLVVLSVNLLGDQMRDHLDARYANVYRT